MRTSRPPLPSRLPGVRIQKSIYEDTAEFIPDKQAMTEKWTFEDAWPKVATWQRRFGDREGIRDDDWFTTSFLSRRRYVSRGKEGRPAYSGRINGLIQSGGADQLYLALGKLVDNLISPEARVVITTHDELVLECPETLAPKAERWLLGGTCGRP
jgi:DNA polymerase I-like protein with 3'-5' exonuclease and polymerase domains